MGPADANQSKKRRSLSLGTSGKRRRSEGASPPGVQGSRRTANAPNTAADASGKRSSAGSHRRHVQRLEATASLAAGEPEQEDVRWRQSPARSMALATAASGPGREDAARQQMNVLCRAWYGEGSARGGGSSSEPAAAGRNDTSLAEGTRAFVGTPSLALDDHSGAEPLKLNGASGVFGVGGGGGGGDEGGAVGGGLLSQWLLPPSKQRPVLFPSCSENRSKLGKCGGGANLAAAAEAGPSGAVTGGVSAAERRTRPPVFGLAPKGRQAMSMKGLASALEALETMQPGAEIALEGSGVAAQRGQLAAAAAASLADSCDSEAFIGQRQPEAGGTAASALSRPQLAPPTARLQAAAKVSGAAVSAAAASAQEAPVLQAGANDVQAQQRGLSERQAAANKDDACRAKVPLSPRRARDNGKGPLNSSGAPTERSAVASSSATADLQLGAAASTGNVASGCNVSGASSRSSSGGSGGGSSGSDGRTAASGQRNRPSSQTGQPSTAPRRAPTMGTRNSAATLQRRPFQPPKQLSQGVHKGSQSNSARPSQLGQTDTTAVRPHLGALRQPLEQLDSHDADRRPGAAASSDALSERPASQSGAASRSGRSAAASRAVPAGRAATGEFDEFGDDLELSSADFLLLDQLEAAASARTRQNSVQEQPTLASAEQSFAPHAAHAAVGSLGLSPSRRPGGAPASALATSRTPPPTTSGRFAAHGGEDHGMGGGGRSPAANRRETAGKATHAAQLQNGSGRSGNSVGNNIAPLGSGAAAARGPNKAAPAANPGAAAQKGLYTTYPSMQAFLHAMDVKRGASNGAGAKQAKQQQPPLQPAKDQLTLADAFARKQQQQQQRQAQMRAIHTGLAGQVTEQVQAAAGDTFSSARSDSPQLCAPLQFGRFVVLDVAFPDDRRETVLRVKAEAHAAQPGCRRDGSFGAGAEEMLVLRDDWCDCQIAVGDVLHVVQLQEGANGAAVSAAALRADRESDCCIVADRSRCLVILHPDVLVSPTRIAEALACERRAVLQSRLPSGGVGCAAAVLGNLKHELFERALTKACELASLNAAFGEDDEEDEWGGGASENSPPMTPATLRLEPDVDAIVAKNTKSLYGAGLSESEARKELLGVTDAVAAWMTAFVGGPAAAGGGGGHGVGAGAAPRNRVRSVVGGGVYDVTVKSLVEAEEEVWCPAMGLKGCIDATVLAAVADVNEQGQQQPSRYSQSNNNNKQLCGSGNAAAPRLVTVPVELKTGKRSQYAAAGHRAQVMLYSLLLRGRYGSDGSSGGGSANGNGSSAQSAGAAGWGGLLVHLSTEGFHAEAVVPQWSELRPLMMLRNRLAVGLARAAGEEAERRNGPGPKPRVSDRDEENEGAQAVGAAAAAAVKPELPPLLGWHSACSRCFQLAECMTYHAALEAGSAATAGLEGNLYHETVGHLQPAHLEYFRAWDGMLDAEARLGEQARRRMWRQKGVEIEASRGPCIAELRLLSTERVRGSADAGAAGDSFRHRFARTDALAAPADAASAVAAIGRRRARLSELGLGVGDCVIVSTDGAGHRGQQHVRLLVGKVTRLTDSSLEVLAGKPIRVPRFGAGASADVEDVAGGGGSAARSLPAENLFRIDRDNLSTGISTMRANLLQLMIGPSPQADIERLQCGDGGDAKGRAGGGVGDQRRRQLIVDMETPRFAQFRGLFAATDASSQGGGRPLPSHEQAAAAAAAVPGCDRAALTQEYDSALNSDQRAAVRKVVGARDYALLLGMPGTGKTSTIAFVARVLLARGASVLITSYTHSAVDNLLLKLRDYGVPCLRVGATSQVHPGLRGCCLECEGGTGSTSAASSAGATIAAAAAGGQRSSQRALLGGGGGDREDATEVLAERVANARVVGCTCLGIKHPAFAKRRFDYCIVDEAGQITQAAVLGPLRCADVFVLVGDHFQLPPLVASAAAAAAGMDVSLFRRLGEAHPAALQQLSFQYRMAADVNLLCNALVYDGRLRCGDASVANQLLALPQQDDLPFPTSSCRNQSVCGNDNGGAVGAAASEQEEEGWLRDVLRPERRVVFLDTDGVLRPPTGQEAAAALAAAAAGAERAARDWEAECASMSSAKVSAKPPAHPPKLWPTVSHATLECSAAGAGNGRGALVNTVEVAIVEALVWALQRGGVCGSDVGVICPYRSQLRLLQSALSRRFPLVEANTIDRYQGRDKKVVIVSFVRSNASASVGELLRDWRRLNVALSRAKAKLVMVGSASTLRGGAMLSALLALLRERSWVYSLPPNAHTAYASGWQVPPSQQSQQQPPVQGLGAAAAAARGAVAAAGASGGGNCDAVPAAGEGPGSPWSCD